eukprot:1159964-Pelagomonas_calceolata.AAC.8
MGQHACWGINRGGGGTMVENETSQPNPSSSPQDGQLWCNMTKLRKKWGELVQPGHRSSDTIIIQVGGPNSFANHMKKLEHRSHYTTCQV